MKYKIKLYCHFYVSCFMSGLCLVPGWVCPMAVSTRAGVPRYPGEGTLDKL